MLGQVRGLSRTRASVFRMHTDIILQTWIVEGHHYYWPCPGRDGEVADLYRGRV